MRTEFEPTASATQSSPEAATRRPTVMLAMNESSRARVLVPVVRDRLERVAHMLPVGPGNAFLTDPTVREALGDSTRCSPAGAVPRSPPRSSPRHRS